MAPAWRAAAVHAHHDEALVGDPLGQQPRAHRGDDHAGTIGWKRPAIDVNDHRVTSARIEGAGTHQPGAKTAVCADFDQFNIRHKRRFFRHRGQFTRARAIGAVHGRPLH